MIPKTSSLLDAIQTPASPFPGLRPFESNENDLFFGRDEQTEKMMDKLTRTRFLAVVGTSGSGKSSLVRAGLMPALHSGMMAGAGSNWRIAVMRPGNYPIGNLASALNAQEVFGSDDAENKTIQIAIAEATLRLGSRGLIETVRQNMMQEAENLLVVVDQFEELFRFAREARKANNDRFDNDAAAFVKLLLEAVKPDQREANIYVVLTMRSDFLGDCSQFWDLPEAINESQYLIPRLTRNQLREVVEGPVAVGGGQIAPRLVNQLLNDITDNQDQLPILQHALMRTWDEWKHPQHEHQSLPGVIDICCCEAIGGMAEALSRHADEAHTEIGKKMGDRGHQITEKIFKALTEKGDDNREIRRPVTFGGICAVTGATASEVIAVIETFRAPGRSFLMPPADVPLDAASLIDISHESLIRVWERLSQWVNQEAISAQRYRRLAQTAALHRDGTEELLHGVGLSAMQDWFAAVAPTEQWAARYPVENSSFPLAMNFLKESQQEAEAEEIRLAKEAHEKEDQQKRELAQAQALAEEQRQRAEEQQQRAEDQERFTKRLRRLSYAMILLALLAISAAAGAYSAYRNAETERAKANTSEKKAIKLREIADDAKLVAVKAAIEAKADKKEAVKQRDIAEQQTKEAIAANNRTEEQRKVAEANADLAKANEKRARQNLYVANINLAQKAYEEGGDAQAQGLLEELIPSAAQIGTETDVRGFDWYYLWRQHHEGRTTLSGHTSSIFAVALSPNGKTLASGSSDKTIKLWDVATGRLLTTLTGHTNYVLSVAFSPDGKTLASSSSTNFDFGSYGNTIILWEVATGKLLTTLTGHTLDVTAVAFSPDGKTLASGSLDKTIKLWEVATRKELYALVHTTPVSSVAFSPDGKTLASGSTTELDTGGNPDNTINLWEVATGKHLTTLQGYNDYVNSVAFSPDGKTLASGSMKSTIRLWEVATRKELPVLEGHTSAIWAVAFSPDGKTLASGSLDKTIKLWEVATGKLLTTLTGHADSVHAVAFSLDGKTLASGSRDMTVRLWEEVAMGKELSTLTTHTSSVNSVAFSPDGRTLASSSRDNTIKLCEVATGSLLTTLTDLSGNVISVAFSLDGKTLASGSYDGTIKLWDVANGKLLTTLTGHTGYVLSVAFSPDGKTLASGSSMTLDPGIYDKTIKLWDVATGKLLTTLTGHTSSIFAVAFSPDGKTLASGSDDRAIKLWDVVTGSPLTTLTGHTDSVYAVAFSPDGRTLASSSWDNTIKLWDVVTGKVLLTANTAVVYSVAFSPDGKTLAYGSGDGAIKLWFAATDEQVKAQRSAKQEAAKPAGKQ